ncbi:MAG: winged helix-turn-helix domain-containing protein [Pseudomonadota bacterium]|nr:winged helix-turn-helix domain-containing protein [Pseudomonadota bacterium]
MSAKLPFALILDSDPEMVLSLRHLFQTICGLATENLSDVPEFSGEDGWPQVIVIGRVSRRATVIAELKEQGAPFILVIDRGEITGEGEEAFLAGADDVIKTPFTLRVLALRLRARIGLLDTPEGRDVLAGAEHWESGAYIASHAGLTSAEAQVAHVLISNSGEIVSRDALSYAIDQRPWDYGDRKFDVHVAKIRKKLNAVFGEHVAVDTVRAAGYKLTIDPTAMQKLLR